MRDPGARPKFRGGGPFEVRSATCDAVSRTRARVLGRRGRGVGPARRRPRRKTSVNPECATWIAQDRERTLAATAEPQRLRLCNWQIGFGRPLDRQFADYNDHMPNSRRRPRAERGLNGQLWKGYGPNPDGPSTAAWIGVGPEALKEVACRLSRASRTRDRVSTNGSRASLTDEPERLSLKARDAADGRRGRRLSERAWRSSSSERILEQGEGPHVLHAFCDGWR